MEEPIIKHRRASSVVQLLHLASLSFGVLGILYPSQSLMAAPVFYATNREQQGTSYGIIRGTHGEHEISYAVLKIDGVEQCPLHLSSLSRDKFFDQIVLAVQQNQHHECCVFVHGYNQECKDACNQGQRLAAELDEPIIVFDWISQHKLKGYLQDECNAEWSLRHFQLLMQGLQKALRDPAQIMLVSHSMGNRLVSWYCDSRYDKSNERPAPFSEIALASPDVDRDTFKHYFYKLVANADKIHIYISKRDKALLASNVIHGYERAGQSENQAPLTWTRPGAVDGMETVDFSYLDKGWIGHSLQYGLIAKMHHNNVPGEGLQAIRDPQFKSFVRIAPTQ